MKHTRQIALICLPLSLLVVLALGCGGNSSAPGRLSGTVRLDGAPVTGGMIVVHTKIGTMQGPISPSGSYTITDIPAGEWKVTVDTEALNPDAKKATAGVYQKKGMSPPPSAAPQGGSLGTYVAIPSDYRAEKSTPLTVTVTTGSTTYNPELKSK